MVTLTQVIRSPVPLLFHRRMEHPSTLCVSRWKPVQVFDQWKEKEEVLSLTQCGWMGSLKGIFHSTEKLIRYHLTTTDEEPFRDTDGKRMADTFGTRSLLYKNKKTKHKLHPHPFKTAICTSFQISAFIIEACRVSVRKNLCLLCLVCSCSIIQTFLRFKSSCPRLNNSDLPHFAGHYIDKETNSMWSPTEIKKNLYFEI